MDVIAFIQVSRVRAEIALQLAHRGPDIIRRIAGQVMAVRNPANRCVAFNCTPSAGHLTWRIHRIRETCPRRYRQGLPADEACQQGRSEALHCRPSS